MSAGHKVKRGFGGFIFKTLVWLCMVFLMIVPPLFMILAEQWLIGVVMFFVFGAIYTRWAFWFFGPPKLRLF